MWKKKYPIGSGVTEAACKVIVKQRLFNSGMKWKGQGAKAVLCLRSLNYTDLVIKILARRQIKIIRRRTIVR